MEFKQQVEIKVTVNGAEIRAIVAAGESLLDFLRKRCGVTDVKCGCGMGECGTCTLVLAGKVVKSCLVLAAQVDGQEVWTLQGLERDPLAARLQDSFARHGAVQCGFCTPGMLIAARGFLQHSPQPTRAEIREALSGNLCRCTGYQKIVDAVWAVAYGDTAEQERA